MSAFSISNIIQWCCRLCCPAHCYSIVRLFVDAVLLPLFRVSALVALKAMFTSNGKISKTCALHDIGSVL